MRGDAIDVLHYRGGIAKDITVDALQNVALPAVCMINAHKDCVIDMTAAETIDRVNVTGQLEALQDVSEVRRQIWRSVTARAGVVAQAPRVKSGKSRALPRSWFDASLSGVTADHAAASYTF